LIFNHEIHSVQANFIQDLGLFFYTSHIRIERARKHLCHSVRKSGLLIASV